MQLRKFFLYGNLSEKFSKDAIELTAQTAPDAMLAFRSIFPAWREHMRDHPELVFILSGDDKENPRGIEVDFIESQFGDATEVHVFPAQEGALMAIPAFAAWAATNVVAAFVINAVASMLISNLLSSVLQSLAPSPQTGSGTKNQVAQNQSFLYNGAVNVQEQGGPVPVIYGYFMSGSTVVSSAVDVEQLLTTPSQSVLPANGGGSTQPTSPAAVSWQWAGV